MMWVNPSRGIVAGLCVSALVHGSVGVALYWYGNGHVHDAESAGKDQSITVTMSLLPDEMSPRGMKVSEIPRYPEPAPHRLLDISLPPRDELDPHHLTLTDVPPPLSLPEPEPVMVQPHALVMEADALNLPAVSSAALDMDLNSGLAPLVGRPTGVQHMVGLGTDDRHGNDRGGVNGLVPDSEIRPVYPRQARREGREGTVVIKAQVNGQGRVDKVDVVTSSGTSSLDQSALSAVRKARFQYLDKNGADNSGIAMLRFHFQLTDDPLSP